MTGNPLLKDNAHTAWRDADSPVQDKRSPGKLPEQRRMRTREAAGLACRQQQQHGRQRQQRANHALHCPGHSVLLPDSPAAEDFVVKTSIICVCLSLVDIL